MPAMPAAYSACDASGFYSSQKINNQPVLDFELTVELNLKNKKKQPLQKLFFLIRLFFFCPRYFFRYTSVQDIKLKSFISFI